MTWTLARVCVCVCSPQRTLQTHVTAPDVVDCLQTQTDPGLCGDGATPTSDCLTVGRRDERSFKQEVDAVDKTVDVHVDLSQVGSYS